METACRTPIPYWDMTTDSEMMDPTRSIVWSDLFFGPGNGPVLTGPFGRFRTPTGTPIIRNIGSGTLIYILTKLIDLKKKLALFVMR
jgi:hypothetical protein